MITALSPQTTQNSTQGLAPGGLAFRVPLDWLVDVAGVSVLMRACAEIEDASCDPAQGGGPLSKLGWSMNWKFKLSRFRVLRCLSCFYWLSKRLLTLRFNTLFYKCFNEFNVLTRSIQSDFYKVDIVENTSCALIGCVNRGGGCLSWFGPRTPC